MDTGEAQPKHEKRKIQVHYTLEFTLEVEADKIDTCNSEMGELDSNADAIADCLLTQIEYALQECGTVKNYQHEHEITV
jgi:hypothetical protein